MGGTSNERGRRGAPRYSTLDPTRGRRPLLALAVFLGLTWVAVPDSTPVRAAPATSSLDGTSPADAAASCWEIKVEHPASGDGEYWLRNDSLVRPQQFYCDMTTDGGGWVLIGRGREGWTFRDYGQNTPDNIREVPTGPAAFSPGALDTVTIDALLDGGHVKDLADGVRLRRAENKSGTAWQEVRWQFLDLTSWSWAFGGGHRLSAWSIDAETGTGSNTKSSATTMPGEVGGGNDGNDRDAWFTFPWSSHGGLAGFSYRGSVDGENNSTSYLWERTTENHAIPFTQVFVRPTITTGTPAPIPDAGDAGRSSGPVARRPTVRTLGWRGRRAEGGRFGAGPRHAGPGVRNDR